MGSKKRQVEDESQGELSREQDVQWMQRQYKLFSEQLKKKLMMQKIVSVILREI